MKSWKEQIVGCFSVEDCKFANHACDIEHAKEMLITALQQGVGYKEFCEAIKNWLRGQLVNADSNVAEESIKREMRKVRKLASYFIEG